MVHASPAPAARMAASPAALERWYSEGPSGSAPRALICTRRPTAARSQAATSLVGSSTLAFVENGKLVLGAWQAIYLCEFDGPRTRTVLIRVLPE